MSRYVFSERIIVYRNIMYQFIVHYAVNCRNFTDDLSKNLLHLKFNCDML